VSDFNKIINGGLEGADIISRASKIDTLSPRIKKNFL
jgi:hypothetical protein